MAVSLDLTKLGSPSALSLFANADTIPAMVAAGAVLAVNAALFTYIEFKNYQEKKHKEHIEEVNMLYLLHLKQIVAPNHGKIHGFPPIFQLVENKYQSMHFTPEQVKDIGSDVIHGTDIALSSYRESVRAAIRKLQEYYFSRKDGKTIKADDVTAGVLSYLMQMLDTKCLNFLGYDYDIAYLDAICKFIVAYSSLKNGSKSQHFSRLAPVYSHLLKAKQKLEKHKEVLSLQETIAELKDSCVSHSDHLIRALVKMVVKDPDTDLADTVAHEELKEGLLRQHYIHSEVLGVELRADYEILIPSSIFKNWIKNLSDYYLKALSTELKQEDKLNSPNEFFDFLNKAKAILGRALFGHSKERDAVEGQLKLIRKVFHESGNFISTRYNKLSKKFEIISDPLHLIDRSLIMAKVAKLTHEVISLQYLCIHLLKSIQLLGDIYVNNPRHFCKIFDVLDKLCVLIQEDVQTTKKAFRELQEDNENNMQIEEKELFPNQIRDILESVFAEIKDLGEQVKDCRQMAVKTIKAHTVKSVNYEMLEIATAISNMYFEESDKPEVESISFIEEDTISEEAANDSNQVKDLDTLILTIYERIGEIQNTELFRAKTYFKIYDALVIMKDKAMLLVDEKSNNPERLDKANRTLKLTETLLNETLDFLNKGTSERQAGASAFFKKIHDQLTDKDNAAFIDRHGNPASRFIYTHLCNYGIFRTDTRKKLAVLEEACQRASYS